MLTCLYIFVHNVIVLPDTFILQYKIEYKYRYSRMHMFLKYNKSPEYCKIILVHYKFENKNFVTENFSTS